MPAAFTTESYYLYNFSGTGDGSPGDPFVGIFTRQAAGNSSTSNGVITETALSGIPADCEFTAGEIINDATSFGNANYFGYLQNGSEIFLLVEAPFGAGYAFIG